MIFKTYRKNIQQMSIPFNEKTLNELYIEVASLNKDNISLIHSIIFNSEKLNDFPISGI